MKKRGKILAILILLISICLISIKCYATVVDPITNPDAYKPSVNEKSNNTKLIEIVNSIIGAVRVLGSAVAVITLMVLGIKYMMASAGEKATYKETMGPYLIGAIMVFTIPNLLGILYDLIVNNINF